MAFNAALATTFDYPDLLRRPTEEVLAPFRAGGTALVVLWWAFAIVFQSFNRDLGVAVGEHLGCLLSGAWTVLLGVAVAVAQSTVARPGSGSWES